MHSNYYEKEAPRETAYQGRTVRVIKKVVRNNAHHDNGVRDEGT